MSALTLFPVVAPVAPTPPNGSSGEAPSGFQSMLAALSDPGPAVPEGASPGAGNSDAGSAEIETSTAADGLPSSPPAATSLPLPLMLPAGEQAAETADGPTQGALPASSALAATDADLALDPVSTAKSAAAAERAGKDSGQIQTWPVTPSTPTEKTDPPPVQPRLPDVPHIDPPAGDGPDSLPKTGPTAETAEAMTRGSTPPPSAPSPPAPPPPLRPLAERASRPVDPLTGKTTEEAALTGSRPPAPAGGAPVAFSLAEASARSVDRAPAAVAAEAVDVGEAEAPTSDLPPLEEGATGQTQGASASREAPASQLSRATIEATAQIAAQILRRLEGRSTRFEMALTPDELGRVDVRLDIDSEGRLNARLAFDNPAAATDLRGRADELRRELEDAGFHLGDDAFEFADRDSNSSAFDRGHDGRNGQSRAFAAASRLNAQIDLSQPPAWLALSLSPSGVDMKV